MLADQLFERTAGSTPATLSCVRGYKSNMASGTVKWSIKCANFNVLVGGVICQLGLRYGKNIKTSFN